MASERSTVMVLFGGSSSEHQISCATAAGVLEVIDRDRWNVIPVGITPEGQWTLQPDDPQRYRIKDGAGYTVTTADQPVSLMVGGSSLYEYQTNADGNPDYTDGTLLGEIDVVLPLLHGPFGEDGTLQGMLEIDHVRYVGCGVTSSAVSMDKHLTKTVLEAAGIPVGHWKVISPRQWAAAPDAVLEGLADLGLPVFVKPCRAGSSMGISRVTDANEMREAIEEARAHDPRVIVEAETPGREVECGVLQLADGTLIASPIGEIVVETAEFYDYETKYFNEDAVTLSCPADLPEDVTSRIQTTALEVFDALQCEGLSRIDCFYNPDTDQVVVNEINTLPGFTPFSMYPTLLREAGVEYQDLINALLEEAMSRPLGLR